MAVNPSALGPKPQFVDSNGNPAVGYQLFFYAAGSSTKQNTFTDSTGNTANTNPLVLNALGQPTTEIWFTEGSAYKAVFAPPNDTDPPTSPVWTVDNILGNNDASTVNDQWVVSGVTPTYVSATQFTLVGDQTSSFTVNRRVKFTVTAGTVYGYISVSAYTTLTTVTVVLDSGTLDGGLSAVLLGLITPTNTSLFLIQNANLASGYINDLTTVTPALGDFIAAADTSDSGNKKKLLNTAVRDLFYPRGYLSGLTMSTAGASATMAIAAGEAKDSTNATVMQLASAISKTTSAWAVGTGNGGIDTGAIANTTWYHFYEIERVDTGVVDVVFSTNASSPTLPTNYTLYRYIGSGLTNGSAQWIKFFQDGDKFIWDVMPTLNVNTTNPGTSAVTATLTTPLGQRVEALISAQLSSIGGSGTTLLVTDLSQTDTAPSQTAAPIGQVTSTPSTAIGLITSAPVSVFTNTSSQVRYRVDTTSANVTVRIGTTGYINPRGKNL